MLRFHKPIVEHFQAPAAGLHDPPRCPRTSSASDKEFAKGRTFAVRRRVGDFNESGDEFWLLHESGVVLRRLHQAPGLGPLLEAREVTLFPAPSASRRALRHEGRAPSCASPSRQAFESVFDGTVRLDGAKIGGGLVCPQALGDVVPKLGKAEPMPRPPKVLARARRLPVALRSMVGTMEQSITTTANRLGHARPARGPGGV